MDYLLCILDNGLGNFDWQHIMLIFKIVFTFCKSIESLINLGELRTETNCNMCCSKI